MSRDDEEVRRLLNDIGESAETPQEATDRMLDAARPQLQAAIAAAGVDPDEPSDDHLELYNALRDLFAEGVQQGLDEVVARFNMAGVPMKRIEVLIVDATNGVDDEPRGA